jgi:protein-S-isoprenylcysteine O-methyltransferase Ste14
MLSTHVLLAIFWIAYCVLHSVLAATTVKKWGATKMKSRFRYYRIAYTIFSFLGLVAILIYQFSIQSSLLYTPILATQIIGVLMMGAGAALMLLMIWKYFMQLSGVKWLSQQEVKSKLEVTGLHRYVRHPLYLGTFVFIWGWFILNPSVSFLICAVIITVYTLVALKFEERKLIEQFGNDYIQYRKEVPSLIPKL